jgi:LuxR family transcriptional regulator, maltose regulon positive regulatory protein
MSTDTAFDLASWKLRRPSTRTGAVRRSALVEQLTQADPRPVVSVVAPAGYGKTTLLSQWAERDERQFAWVSVDDRDNDARVLLSYVAEALDRLEPVGDRVSEALSSPVSSVPGSVVPRLATALATRRSPVVLVLDDVHLLYNSEARAALSVLAEEVPRGSRIVLAGREMPPVRVARLRAEDRITEIGPDQLSMSLEESSQLLLAAEVALDEEDLTTLHGRAEGWPVGLYLAALSLRQGGSIDAVAQSFNGEDRFVSDYFESEVLARIPSDERAFLTRSAALERMSAALCEATLDLPRAATTLAGLVRSNMLLVPLDRRGHWYRYHHLFGDMLRGELERGEPEMMPTIRRRAASWCLANDQPEEAVDYSIAAEDAETAAQLVEAIGLDVYWHGHRNNLDRWIKWLDERDVIKAHPMIAVIASFLCLSTMRETEAQRWADLLDQWQYREPGWTGDPATEAYAAMARASQCRFGIEQMRADVEEAATKFEAAGVETPNLGVYRGLIDLLSGEVEQGDALFQHAIRESEQTDMQEILACALYERSLVAMARQDWAEAGGLADRLQAAVTRPGSEEVFVWVARARVAAQCGDLAAAVHALARAQPLRAQMTMPVFSVQNRIELAHAYLALDDVSGARTVMREAEEILRQHDLGTLGSEAAALSARLEKAEVRPATGPSTLTSAELRLVPLLCTHLTAPEIAAELYLSRHTVRSQMQSIYRKLHVNNRRQAVSRARELHLVD